MVNALFRLHVTMSTLAIVEKPQIVNLYSRFLIILFNKKSEANENSISK